MEDKIKVLVVDDEPMMRSAYPSLIEWEENGFCLAGCARNGKEALEIIKEKGAEIVITDLKMPVMTGLELISAARSEFPDIKFIVVSGFDDFPLVKEAYSLGAKDYFLKFEIEPDVILEKLIALGNEIREEKKKIEKQIKEIEELERLRGLEKLVSSSNYVIREKLLKELLWSPNSNEIVEKMRSCGIILEEKANCIMVLTLYGYSDKEEQEWNGEHELFKYAILNVLDEICQKREKCYVFCNLLNEYVIVTSDGNCANSIFEEMRLALSECFSLECSGGMSDSCESFGELKHMYRNAKLADGYSFAAGKRELLVYSNIRKINGTIDASEKLIMLKRALGSMNHDDIIDVAEKLRIEPTAIGCEQIDEVKNLFYLYYSEIVNFTEAENIREELKNELQEYKAARQKDSLSDMNSWIVKILGRISEIMTGEHIIVKAKIFIKNHYREQITLSMIAEMLQVSESHLSRLFAKMQKESFSQYLQRTRMNAAIELLRVSNMKIYEIAKEVGYTNSEQFSRMFKKVVGSSPKAFLNK